MELYKKYRPTDLSEVVGQPDAVRVLTDMVKRRDVPHTILFSGPSGVGKTTIARILKEDIGCGDQDFKEINAADTRGIDDVRNIREFMGLAPMSGRCRVYLVDECHNLTKDAQTAALKMLEDTPRHVYFMLATTEPGKLLPTIRTRSTHLELKPVGVADMQTLVKRVAKAENFVMSDGLLDKIVEVAEGSCRKALVLLETAIAAGTDEDDQINAVKGGAHQEEAIRIARLLVAGGTKWGEMAKCLKECKELTNDGVEGLRYMVLGYAKAILLNGKQDPRCCAIIEEFGRHMFDSKTAGFVLACYAVINPPK